MKLDTFFDKFDQFAGAPNGVTKMRELILESAIRGRLVPQDPSDEPASELLKRLVSVQGGQGRRQAVLAPVGDDDACFQIPRGWEWTRLGSTGRIFNGNSVSESGKAELARVEDGVPFIATKDVGYGRDKLLYDNGLKVPFGDPRFKVAPANTVLICAEGGSAGRKIGITDRQICFGNKLFANDVWEGIHPRYIFFLYQAPTFFSGFAARMTGIIGGIARSDFLSLPVPLPPEAEQKRIVEKVDQLLALCDRLEAQQQDRETRHTALVRASLSRFSDAPCPANLHVLFHPSYPIPPADLRKAILALAVQGKLVPQDPNDGNAREMIDRAIEKRQQTIKTKGLRLRELDESADLFRRQDLPSSWCVERLANLVDPENTISYGVLVPGNDVPDGIPFVRAQDLCLSNHPLRPNKTIAPEIEKPYARTRLVGGEILLCVVGSIGKLGVAPDSWAGANIARAVARIKPMPEVLRDYLLLVLQEQSVQRYFTSTTRTLAQPTLNVGMIEHTPIPIPPFAEQRRIVAKVGHLMTLVEELEAHLAVCGTKGASLMDAIVSELTVGA